MKNIATLICLTLCLAFSCKEEDEEYVSVPSVNISTGENLELNYQEQEFNIAIRSDNFEWTFKFVDAPSWVSADVLEGDSTFVIKAKAKRNTALKSREVVGILDYIKNGVAGTDKITITQLGESYEIDFSKSQLYLKHNETQQIIGLASNGAYTIVESPSWAALTLVPPVQPLDTIETVIKLDTNTSYAYRSGVIKLKQDDKNVTDSISLYQFGIGDLKSDSLALVALYNSAGGADWTKKWDLSKSISEWEGITVTDLSDIINDEIIEGLQGKRVTAIRLENNNLVGVIPADITNISYLQYLVLNDNKLSGDLPSSFGVFQDLIWVYLQDNELTGVIPELIGNSTLMDRLYLYNNQFSGEIPSSLEKITSITTIDFSNNNLEGSLPSGMGALKGLKLLRLNGNRLSGSIPSTFINNSSATNWDAEENICPQQTGYGFQNCDKIANPF